MPKCAQAWGSAITALVHAGLRQTEQVFAWLQRAYDDRAWDLVQLRVDMRFDAVHDDARFTDLLRRLNLQPAK